MNKNKNYRKQHLRRPRLAPCLDSQTPLHPSDPVLRFALPAWSKLVFLCHAGQTEIGGFGITSADDPLLVEEFVTVRQRTTAATVSFEDDAVAEFFEAQVDAGRKPEQFARVWLHTHPGDSPEPSFVDEQTFDSAFGTCNWAIMFILSRTGKTYARLRFNVGPAGEIRLPVEVDLNCPYPASEHEAWEAEYLANVMPQLPETKPPAWTLDGSGALSMSQPLDEDFFVFGGEDLVAPGFSKLLADFRKLERTERQAFLDEVAEHPDLWAEEEGYLYEWS